MCYGFWVWLDKKFDNLAPARDEEGRVQPFEQKTTYKFTDMLELLIFTPCLYCVDAIARTGEYLNNMLSVSTKRKEEEKP